MNVVPKICFVSILMLIPAMSLGFEKMPTYSRGTLNLVLGDSDCLIVATDSRATIRYANGKTGREDNHQKLFLVPGEFVVTIAGYGSVDVPAAPEFTSPAAGIIFDYIEQLKNQNRTPSYDEVVDTLQYLVTFNLTSVGNINAWYFGSINTGNYEFIMLISGRQNSGFIVTKVLITMGLAGDKQHGYYVRSYVSDIKKHIVRDFSFETAGMDKIALSMLTKISEEKKKLSCEELELMVNSIMAETGKVYDEVGGPIQFAFLSRDKTNLRLPSFHRPAGPRIRHNLFVGGGFSNTGQAVVSDSPFLFIASTFINSGIILDGNYFFGCKFRNCKIYVTSNNFSFHMSNGVYNCKLYLGRKVNIESETIKNLLGRFGKGDIYFEKGKE